MNICLIGPPGCGKTTIASGLQEALGVRHISTGAIARRMAEDDAGAKIALQQGAMAPEEAIRVLTQTALENATIQTGGWVLEGFPRTVAQLVCLMQWQPALPCFVQIDLTEFACVERLVARGRKDDNPDSIARRLQSFYDKTVTVLAMLENGGVLRRLEYEGMTPEHAVQEISAWVR